MKCKILILAMLGVLLSACGNKGPLVSPDDVDRKPEKDSLSYVPELIRAEIRGS